MSDAKLDLSADWALEDSVRASAWRLQTPKSTVTLPSGGQLVAEVDELDAARAAVAGVIDLTLLPRTGLRGANATEWLSSHNLPVPMRPNLAAASSDGSWVMRLSQREFWVLGNPQTLGAWTWEADQALQQHWLDRAEPALYPLFCMDSHAWLVLTGERAVDVMAKLCAVDLTDPGFVEGQIAQTSIARINGIVLKHHLGELDACSILCDRASAPYLWPVLLDAVTEFGGGAVGIDCLSASVAKGDA